MATAKGNAGTVRIGANAIAEIQSWTLEQDTEMIEDTSMGDSDRTFVAGLAGWRGTLDCWWNALDTNGQELLNNGETATLRLNPGGTASTQIYYEGTVFISNLSRTGEKEGSMVGVSFSFQGSGALTQAAEA